MTAVKKSLTDQPNPILRHLNSETDLTIGATDGSFLFTSESTSFTLYSCRNFDELNVDENSIETSPISVDVYEQVKIATFRDMLLSISGDFSKLCLTQHQVLKFIESHREWLRDEGYATFFLFRSGEILLTAYVYETSAGQIEICTASLDYNLVWSPNNRLRVVLPRLLDN